MAETLQERQENELEALQAIFMDDFLDLRCKENSENVPPHILLKLQPCESMRQNESHVSLDLIVKYPEEYPNRSPELKLQNAKGLPKDKVIELEREIQCIAANLVGEVMILQLAQHVQGFLHQNNVPPPSSFYEEMMAKKKKDMEQQKAAEKEKKEKERKANVMQIEEEEQQIREEMMRREEILKNMRKRSQKEKENVRVGIMSQNTPNEGEKRIADGPTVHQKIRQKSISEDVEPYNGMRVLTFQNKKQHIVHCGKCLGHGPSGSSVFCGLDISTGEVVALSEWHFKGQVPKRPTSDKAKVDDEKLSKQVSNIEQEINSLITRVNHCNLVHYLGVMQVHENNMVTLQVLTEFVAGGNLTKELRPGGLPLEIVKEYAQQLLEVLAYLHGKSIVHKDIKLSSVFIDEEKKLRLADYSVGRRLCDLYQTHGERKISRKLSTQDLKSSQKYRRMDILNLGLLMLSLMEGDIVSSVPPKIPQSFPAKLQDFFKRCLYPENGDQWSAHQLLNHSFIAPARPYSSALNSSSENGDAISSTRDQESHAEENATPDLISEVPFSCVNVVGISRLKSEFEILHSLGKGGFGSVIKVRNKLDGCLYAIKGIPLNPKSVQFNRRITREVKLLSRLNHENIVRYYNSWIEVEEEPDSESTESEVKSSGNEPKEKCLAEDSLMRYNVIEPPSICATEDDDLSWGSEKIGNKDIDNDDSSTFSSSDEEVVDKPTKPTLPSNLNESSDDIMFTRNMEDSFRQFGGSLPTEEEESDYGSEEEITSEASQDTRGGLQYLYIQMELCEKSTLKSVIDEGLFKNQERVWRLLREIVEGLVHVHSQGMIHRDLKPVNIFLDSNDRVKIGDFGLATAHPFIKGGAHIETDVQKTCLDNPLTNESMTGKVGTALYVSPELGNAFSMTRYTQKVDLYSLGVIFFEMCYRPLKTTMERVKILGNLRTEKVKLPEDFDTQRLEKQAYIIRWLLRHNPDERPTSQELLKSQHIPPKIEDNELEEILNHTLATTNSTRYRNLISSMMNQEIDQNRLDLTYDYDLVTAQLSCKHAIAQQLVHDKLVNVFRRRGILMLDTPLLVPKTKVYKQAETLVTVMDHSGAILTLPHDLRTSLARYLARNKFPSLKRYSISNVYRDSRILGVHPREHWECAVDIATCLPSDHVPDAEILCIVGEVIEQFSSLNSRNYYIRINHANLTRFILAANGVAESEIPDVIFLLQERRREMDRLQHLKKFLESLLLSDKTIVNICRWLLTETHIDEAKSAFGHIVRGKRTVNNRVRNAIQDLEKIVNHARRMGLTLPVMLFPSLVNDIQRMSGALFQFVTEKKRKAKSSGMDLLAVGGRYDKLISVFCRGRELPAGYGAVGVSMNIERIIQRVLQEEERNDLQLRMCDVLVCAAGENPLLVERTSIVRRLSGQLNVSATIWYEPLSDSLLDETQAYCKDCGIQYLVIMEENAPTRIRIIEKEKEVKGVDDPVEYLKQKFQEPVENCEREIPPHVGHRTSLTSSESNTQSQPKFNIDFVLQEKLERNVRRRYESHMISKVTHILQGFGGHRNPYVILGVDLPVSVLRSISAMLDLTEDASTTKFTASVKMICEKLNQIRYRRQVPYVCDKIREEKANLATPVLFLYSCTDEQCVIMQV